MPAPQTEVLITMDGVEHARHVLIPGDYILGQNPDCHLHVDANLVSSEHARLILNYDNALIEDLGSGNGTFVNDQLVTARTRLWPNQKIRIGAATVMLRRLQGETPTDMSLAPAQQAIRRMLPAEMLREKKYDIGAVVARGGMGAILDAREAAIERKVAMKVMLDTNDADAIARFVAEAKVTGQLEHPNIVPVHELGVDENGQPFYTMKMVRGFTLNKVLKLLVGGDEATVKKYSLPALLTIFQKVCDALAFAHSKGVIHRDLKPENIMLDDFGEVLLMDWGLAKVLVPIRAAKSAGPGQELRSMVHTASLDGQTGSMTIAGTIMGTPQFMSPEQARGEVDSLDARSDIYSLGAILYQILTLRVPVSSKDAMEVVGKVACGEIEPLANPKSAIPDSLAAVVRKAMALDKAARYRSVAELQRDIEAYQNGFATIAENAGTWKQITLLIKRHKTATIGIAAVLLVGVTFGTKAIIEARRAERGEALAIAEAKRAEGALDDLRRQAPALRQLAESEAGFQRFDSALDKLDAALTLDPTHLPGYWRRAWLLIGMERLTDAAAAIRVAQQKDPTHAELASILPTVEKLIAGVLANEPWAADDARRLFFHLRKVGASGETVALSAKLTLGAKENEKLVRQRLDEWLGKGKGFIFIHNAGWLGLNLVSLPINSVEPLRGLPITELDLSNTGVSDLEPLRGMQLVSLIVYNTKVSDLSPLRGMPLRNIALNGSKVTDLSPLRGAPLDTINASGRLSILDFSPLRGAPLRVVNIQDMDVRDLSFLHDAPVEEADIGANKITDLSPLRGKPLRKFLARDNPISDLSPLRGAPIEELVINGAPSRADLAPLLDLPKLKKLGVSDMGRRLESLRSHPSLKSITVGLNPERPVAEFWEEYDVRMAKINARVASSLAAMSVPERDVGVTYNPDGTVNLNFDKTPVRDLSPLKGLPLARLEIKNANFTDLSHLKGMALKELRLVNCPATDLSPLAGMPLEYLGLGLNRDPAGRRFNGFRDLSPLRGMPLKRIGIEGLENPDLSPLADCKELEGIVLPVSVQNLEVLRQLPKLKGLSWGYPGDWDKITPAAKFWAEYDAKQAGQKK